MYFRNIKYFCLVVLAFIALPLFSAHALTVSPARLEIEGDPSSQLKADLLLMNDKDENQTFFSSYANFQAQGESGTPSFVEGGDDLASWMNVPDTITLAPFETKTVPLLITIPSGADPGGHFAAVFWSTQAPHSTESGQVAIGAKLGILILLRVNGDIKEGGSILGFDTKDHIRSYDALPVGFTYRFSNSGDDRVKPVGNIVIRSIFGWKSAVVDANSNQGNVLPRSIRHFDAMWAKDNKSTDPENLPSGFWSKVGYEWKNFAFGRYKATLTLAYTEKNLTDSSALSFYVIPWQLLIVIIISLIILYFILRTMLRSYNRMLISQVRNKIEEEIEEKNEVTDRRHESHPGHHGPDHEKSHRPRPRV